MTNTWIPPQRLAEIREMMNSRDQLITDVLVETGFRLDDIMHIRKSSLSGCSVHLREMKTGRYRTANLSPETARRLTEYAAKRHTLSYLFPALRRAKRKKQHRSTYWRHFVRAAKTPVMQDAGTHPTVCARFMPLPFCSAQEALQRFKRTWGIPIYPPRQYMRSPIVCDGGERFFCNTFQFVASQTGRSRSPHAAPVCLGTGFFRRGIVAA